MVHTRMAGKSKSNQAFVVSKNSRAFPQIVYQLVLVDVTRGYRVTSFSLLTTSTEIALFYYNGRYDTRAEKNQPSKDTSVYNCYATSSLKQLAALET